VKRCFDPSQQELMDMAQLVDGRPPSELERDLANLRWINRRFGAISLLRQFLRRWFSDRLPQSPTLRVLDLATGEGDLPREIVQWCRRRGLVVLIDAVDLNAATLAVARERSTSFPEIAFHQGDIRDWGEDLSPGGESFGALAGWDLVLCSLALHHFSSEDATAVLRNAHRLASRRAAANPSSDSPPSHLLVADLERSRTGLIGIWLLTALLLREPMTVHDARLSIRRAFSFPEFGALARAAGWRDFSQARFPITRQVLWMDAVSGRGDSGLSILG
jgi:SAM-dependent methyltransferase